MTAGAGRVLAVAGAVVAEALVWELGRYTTTESFAWFRVAAHLGSAGALVAFVCGGILAALAARFGADGDGQAPSSRSRWFGAVGLLAGAALVHAPFVGVAQAQPDAVSWYVVAQRIAQSPWRLWAHWPREVWGSPEGAFHHHLPLVPSVLGMVLRWAPAVVPPGAGAADLGPGPGEAVMTAWALALPFAGVWALRGLAPTVAPARFWLAGWLLLAFPLLQAHSGWLLADLPTCVMVMGAWGALARVRPGGRARAGGLAALAVLLALATKVTAAGYLLGPVVLVVSRAAPIRRGYVGWVALGLAFLGVAALRPPHLEAWSWAPSVAAALVVQVRPLLLVGAGMLAWGAWRRRGGAGSVGEWLAAVALFAVPMVLLYAPMEHAPRYGLPLGCALALATAAIAPRALGGYLVGSGLVLLMGGYLPIVRYNQAANLQEATAAVEAAGATRLVVYADAPQSSFPVDGLAALVDWYSPLPVVAGDALALAPPGPRPHWWEVFVGPAWLHAEPGAAAPDGALLCLYGTGPERFEAAHPEWARMGRVARYQASSFLLPREVVYYRPNLSGELPIP